MQVVKPENLVLNVRKQVKELKMNGNEGKK